MVRSTVWRRLLLSAAVSALLIGGANAQTASNVNAAKLISGFSVLGNTNEGRQVLDQNLSTAISINNNSSDAVREQAIKDNTIGSLFGSLSNGMNVADGLGPELYTIFATKNSVSKNYTFTGLSQNYINLFSQLNTLAVAGDSAFSKNFFANGSVDGNPAHPAAGITLPSGGVYNVYDKAYHPDPANANTVGDSRPVQVAPDQIQSFTGKDFFGISTDTATDILPTVKSNASFPSGHAAAGFMASTLLAMMVPERYQEQLTRGGEFGNSRVVLGVHYPLDVIGARIQTTYAIVQALNNNPDYLNQTVPGLLGGTVTTTSDFKTLFTAAQNDLRTLLNAGCNGDLSACAHTGTSATDRFADWATNKANYTYWLTYGLSPVGATNLDPVVPDGAEVLIASRFPYLSTMQLRDVLASTELPSGQPLDDGSGYARLNLFNAADGYGAFNGTVSVTMDASKGGVNAYDLWKNDIGDYVSPATGVVTPGSLVKEGSGTLELTGNNSWSGSTTVNGGALVFTGRSVLSGAFVNNSTLSLTNFDGSAGHSLTVGSYQGAVGSQLVLALGRSGSGMVSDTLVITGDVTPSTSTTITLYDMTTGQAGRYDPQGTPLVVVADGKQAAQGNFRLNEGPVRKGLFEYNLAYKNDPQWLLVSLPSSDAYRLATLATATQSIWQDSAAIISNHQTDLRDMHAAGKTNGTPLWVQAFGKWSSRDNNRAFSSYDSSFSAEAGYDQTTAGVIAGVDAGFANAFKQGDAVLVGLSAGYLNSSQEFKRSQTKAEYNGATLSLSGTYLYQGFFAHAMVKADLLNLDFTAPDLAPFGTSKQSVNAYSYGAMGDVGYRFNLSALGYIEPVLSLAYVESNIGAMDLAQNAVRFKNSDALHGRLGLRAGYTLAEDKTYRVVLSGTASWWNKLSGNSNALFDGGVDTPTLKLTDKHVRNIGDLSLSLNYINLSKNWSAFIKGNYQFGSSYNAGGVSSGFRYNF